MLAPCFIWIENLMTFLKDKIVVSSASHVLMFQVQMDFFEECKFACRIESLEPEDATSFIRKIEDGYKVNM